ncbi:unnamed protein product, partial [Pocillopora meandrina]
VRVADLAAKDSIVATEAADDLDYDYYLIKVTSDGVRYFFVRENVIDMTYKLDKNKTAFVLAGTVR